MSELRQVKASAGSGKTYQLTGRFLSLLDNAGQSDRIFTCKGRGPGGYSWPEILAVTFTNKAAAEMKERVVLALKQGALGLGERAELETHDRLRDEAHLQGILRRYHKLNIRTIDSLLNLILRLFALEFGIRPDFELQFDESDVFTTAYDNFLASCEVAPERDEILSKAVTTMLTAESRKSFWLGDAIRDRLYGIINFLRENKGPFTTDQNALREKLTKAAATLKSYVSAMNGYLKENSLPASANFKKCLAKLEAQDLFSSPGKDSALLHKPSLCDCINKAGKDKVDQRGEAFYAGLKSAWQEFKCEQATLAGAYWLAPAVEMAAVIMDAITDIERSKGMVLGSALAGYVNRLLDVPAVPEAFCRMGCRLHHMLIDEFQDTSRAQWNAIQPLGEECLAKGGSLYYVGDVKQAIYGWRGGDADLFDEIPHIPELSGTAAGRNIQTLPDNWRSHKNVVEFNNDFFSLFEQDDATEELAAELFDPPPEGFIQDFARQIGQDFKDCAQGVAPRNEDTQGYVRMETVAGGRNEEVETAALERLPILLDGILSRRPMSDVAILVRTKAHGAAVCDLLVEQGIPVITESSLRLNRHPVVKQIIALLQFLDYPRNDLALAEFITGNEIFLAEAEIDSKRMYEWLTKQGARPLGAALAEDFPQAWDRLIRPFYNKAGVMTPYDLVQDVARAFRIEERHPQSILYLKRFLEVVHLAEEKGMGALSAFLDFWKEKSDEEKVPLPENVDAIRIMTIHKSKGLEFPVVIVPFHHWKVRPDQDFTVRTVDGMRLVTPMKKELGKPYFSSLGRSIREQLNLLYVAWTRAREELYGLYPESIGRDYPACKAMTLLLEPDENGITEQGARPQAQQRQIKPLPDNAAVKLKTKSEPVELMKWLPRLRVYRHTLDEYSYNERMRGEVAHRAMEHLMLTGNDDTDMHRASRLAMRDFPALGALDETELKNLEHELDGMLAWALSHPKLRTWISEGQSEPEIMDESGNFHRVDHLYSDENQTVVVEFKTGGVYDEHEQQVLRYLNLLRNMPDSGKELSGVIVYLDRQEIREVEI